MVDNSINLCKHISGWFFVIGQSGQATSSWSEAPSDFSCWHFHWPPQDMTLPPNLAWVALKRELAAMGKRATRAPSIVGWFYRLPSLVYAAGSVAPPACPLALAAARALSV